MGWKDFSLKTKYLWIYELQPNSSLLLQGNIIPHWKALISENLDLGIHAPFRFQLHHSLGNTFYLILKSLINGVTSHLHMSVGVERRTNPDLNYFFRTKNLKGVHGCNFNMELETYKKVLDFYFFFFWNINWYKGVTQKCCFVPDNS